MTNNFSIQIKAAFLIMVFALNTVVGFACILGVDMGFNSEHHQDKRIVHVHSNGKKHVRQKQTGNDNPGKSHHHDSAGIGQKANNNKDNCCSNSVMKFEQLDKSVAQTYACISPVFFTAFLSSFYDNGVIWFSQGAPPTLKYFVRSYHPPIPDIRIAIRSFQI